MRHSLLVLLLSGCSSASLSVLSGNDELDFGEIDFMQERPDEGYSVQEIVLLNDGGRELQVEIHGFDAVHLQLTALLADSSPPTLLPIAPDDTNVLRVGVLDYEPGERDTLVSGSFTLRADGLSEPVPIDWSFTPVRSLQ